MAKWLVFLLTLFVSGVAAHAQTRQGLTPITRPPNPFVFSAGYVLGHAVRPSAQGVIIKFFEAEILMGVESVPGGVVNDTCVNYRLRQMQDTPTDLSSREALHAAEQMCSRPINPFYLSSYDSSWRETFQKADRAPLSLFRFKGYIYHPFLRSNYSVKEIFPVDPDAQVKPATLDQSGSFLVYSNVNYGISQYDGRVVIASEDGIVRRRFHIVMQVGSAGGKFVSLNVPTRKLFDFIVDAMATGRVMRVHYYILYGPQAAPSNLLRGYETNSRVYRVDLL